MDDNEVYIGQRLRTLRREHGWLLTDVAEFTQIPVSSLASYERDDTIIPSDRLAQLCRLYRVSADYILSGSQDAFFLQRQWPEWIDLSLYALNKLGPEKKAKLKTILDLLLNNPDNIDKVVCFLREQGGKNDNT